MRHMACRRAAMQAEQRLARELGDGRDRMADLRAHSTRHCMRWLLGGGFVVGAALERLPLRSLGTLARLCFGVTSFVLRLPLGALLASRLAAAPPTRATQESAPKIPP